jgi:hypothetical protein
MIDLSQSGGHILLQGYTLKQLEYKSGGTSNIENLYIKFMLKDLFVYNLNENCYYLH